MPDGELHDQISRLEEQIEELADASERCRKISLISKAFMGGGGLWMVAVVVGAIGFDLTAMIGAIAAVIGGIVVFGSNASTSQQIVAAAKAAEAQRAELIGRLDLRVVEDGISRH